MLHDSTYDENWHYVLKILTNFYNSKDIIHKITQPYWGPIIITGLWCAVTLYCMRFVYKFHEKFTCILTQSLFLFFLFVIIFIINIAIHWIQINFQDTFINYINAAKKIKKLMPNINNATIIIDELIVKNQQFIILNNSWENLITLIIDKHNLIDDMSRIYIFNEWNKDISILYWNKKETDKINYKKINIVSKNFIIFTIYNDNIIVIQSGKKKNKTIDGVITKTIATYHAKSIQTINLLYDEAQLKNYGYCVFETSSRIDVINILNWDNKIIKQFVENLDYKYWDNNIPSGNVYILLLYDEFKNYKYIIKNKYDYDVVDKCVDFENDDLFNKIKYYGVKYSDVVSDFNIDKYFNYLIVCIVFSVIILLLWFIVSMHVFNIDDIVSCN